MSSHELFIGRTEELKRLRKDVFFVEPGSCGYCYSLIGLNGIGKTTLIRHLCEEFIQNQPSNTFYFATVLEEEITFWEYWSNLIRRFSEEIDEEYISSLFESPTMGQRNAIKKIKNIYRLVNIDCDNMEADVYRARLTIALDDLFRYYTILGIRIILTIDEFDRAQDIFSNGHFFQRLFGLTPKGSLTALNLSIMTISRRRVSTIAHHMQEGSNFEDAFPPLVLKGFNDTELKAYFNTYEHLPCGLLPEEAQKQILYLCGRSPGLLMRMRHEFEFMEETSTDIGWIYAEHGQFIKVAYNRMITLMESTFADRAHMKPLLGIFIQRFIGPAYDDDFEHELPLLYDYGFVTKGSAANNIFTLSGAQPEQTKHEVTYEPIAPYFVDYIKHTIIPHDLNNLSNLLIKAEKRIREIIETELSLAFPDNWEEKVNGYASQKDYYLETLQIRALKNDFSSGSITKLNVISFKEYYAILDDYWHLFKKYFTGYSQKDDLRAAMLLLNASRNDSAHINLNVYNGASRKALRETCEKFISCLETTQAPSPSSNGTAMPSSEGKEKTALETTVITFCCQEIKKPRGNLRGVIKETGIAASIPRNNLAAFGFAERPQVGDEFDAMIDHWDNNAEVYILTAPVKKGNE